MKAMNSLIHPLLFPVPKIAPNLPRNSPNDCEVHEVTTPNNYSIPLVYLPVPEHVKKGKGKGQQDLKC